LACCIGGGVGGRGEGVPDLAIAIPNLDEPIDKWGRSLLFRKLLDKPTIS
jgi:hypothetical protein